MNLLSYILKMKIKKLMLYGALLAIVSSCSKEKILLEDVNSNSSGIDFINKIEDSSELSILDYLYFYNGGGVAAGDFNNDGLEDLFFVSNTGENKLYQNRGSLKFSDITNSTGIKKISSWNSGVSVVDINNDGWLDIYISSVVGIHSFRGHNELYVNQQDGTFREASREYNLDIQTYAIHSVFFDFDRDGDLDLYLLNHGVHSNSNYEREGLTNNENILPSNDRLLENRNGKFIDITKESGLIIGNVGYGLAVSAADINQDGWDDIYVSNDFFENDYLYINQKNGTFKESLNEYINSSSQFSMGNDIVDLNQDGYPEIFSLDMLPNDEKILKKTTGEMSPSDLIRRRKLGYSDQFPRNHLQLNIKGEKFLEIANYSNVSATDWSWSTVFSDLDLDGIKDLYITNGILKRPNDGDYVKYISSERIRNTLQSTKLLDTKALDIMPSGSVQNRVYKGTDSLNFIDKSTIWSNLKPSLSNGMVHADLDNDGDLDIVTNNVNKEATLLENKSVDLKKGGYLKITLKGSLNNLNGLGAKIYCYSSNGLIYEQLRNSRGYLSSLPNTIHLGLGQAKIDSLRIIWPDQKTEILYNIDKNQTISFKYKRELSKLDETFFNTKTTSIYSKQIISDLGYSELEYPEFNRERLLPYGLTDRNPIISTSDINNDGVDDFYVGGSKGYEGRIFISEGGDWKEILVEDFKKHIKFEDTDAMFTDIDLDGDLDLYVVSGGSEYQKKSVYLKDRIYLNDGKLNFSYAPDKLPEFFNNGSTIAAADLDKDGDFDYFIGSRSDSNSFGRMPDSFLLINNHGTLEISEQRWLKELGFVNDATFFDFDKDGDDDLWVAQEWGSPLIFENSNGSFKNISEKVLKTPVLGLWQKMMVYDIDGDNDLDVVMGNIGLNTRFKAPLKMFVNDFDHNGDLETIVAHPINDIYFPIDSKDKLESQLIGLIKKRFPDYESFAGKSVEEIFGNKILEKSKILNVNELRTGIFKNDNGVFEFNPLPYNFQFGQTSTLEKINYLGKDGILFSGLKSDLPPYQGVWKSHMHNVLWMDGTTDNLSSLGIEIPKDRFSIKQMQGGQKDIIVIAKDGPIIKYNTNN
ncbi:VCBS repeat-containing protein [Flavobacteriaceae bacterium]|nr:VCBS repeat-containing protein [Flavobacteriaceae bacterium]